MLELRFSLGARLPQVGHDPALPLEVCETSHTLLARAIIERICLRLEIRDLALDRFGSIPGVTKVELGERRRHEHCLPVDSIRRRADIRNELALGFGHRQY